MAVPFTFILNEGSGSQDVATLQAILQRVIPGERLGSVYVIRHGDDFDQVLDQAVDDCRRCSGILVAAGGDGTLSSVICRIMPLAIPLGIIPLGTFNYFARQYDIPVEPEQAVASLLTAEPVKLPVCLLNDEPFLVNVSLGIHTKIIEARERHTRLTGRNRLVAFVSGVITLLKERYSLRARLTLDGRRLQRRATMVLVSNNRLQLENLALAEEEGGDKSGEGMAVVIMRPLSRRALVMLMWRRLSGHLESEPDLERYRALRVDIELTRSVASVVVDGELRRCRTPLRLRLQPDAMTCLLPRAAEGAS